MKPIDIETKDNTLGKARDACRRAKRPFVLRDAVWSSYSHAVFDIERATYLFIRTTLRDRIAGLKDG